MSQRMTLAFSDSMNNDMVEVINKFELTSKIEVLRNAFVVYKVLLEEIAKGNKVCITNKEDKLLKEIVVV